MKSTFEKIVESKSGASLVAGVVTLTVVGAISSALYISQARATLPFVQRNTSKDVLYNPSVPSKPFPNVTLNAKAAIVYDVTSGKVLYDHQSTRQLPLASLTKLMTSLVATEMLADGAAIPVTDYALTAEGDSGLIAGETWKFSDLLSYTMITSSNDGARAIASAAGALTAQENERDAEAARSHFVSRMNQRAKEIGLSKTYFVNETGLDATNTTSGSYGTAADVAKMLSFMLTNNPRAFSDTKYLEETLYSEEGTIYVAENTNQYVGSIPGLIASKTGYTDLAGGNLAILFDAGLNQPVAIVVLGSSREERFSDVERLVKATYVYLDSK